MKNNKLTNKRKKNYNLKNIKPILEENVVMELRYTRKENERYVNQKDYIQKN